MINSPSSISAQEMALSSIELACIRFFDKIPETASYKGAKLEFQKVATDRMTLNSAMLFFIGLTGKFVFNKDILDGLTFKVLYNDDNLRFFSSSTEHMVSQKSLMLSIMTLSSSEILAEYIELDKDDALVLDGIFNFLEELLVFYKNDIENIGCRFTIDDISLGIEQLKFQKQEKLHPNHKIQGTRHDFNS